MVNQSNRGPTGYVFGQSILLQWKSVKVNTNNDTDHCNYFSTRFIQNKPTIKYEIVQMILSMSRVQG